MKHRWKRDRKGEQSETMNQLKDRWKSGGKYDKLSENRWKEIKTVKSENMKQLKDRWKKDEK